MTMHFKSTAFIAAAFARARAVGMKHDGLTARPFKLMLDLRTGVVVIAERCSNETGKRVSKARATLPIESRPAVYRNTAQCLGH